MLAALGALDWKPVLSALLLPPVPMLVLLLAGMLLRAGRRPLMGLALILLSLAGLWFAHCQITGLWIEHRWLKPPPVLQPDHLSALRHELAGRRTAVLVLIDNAERYAPEYGDAMLGDRALQRLHYGLWLARRLDVPVMVSGGRTVGQTGDSGQASVAARVAERDMGRTVRWQDAQSTDTRGHARRSLPLLNTQGITDVVLVTHAWHMPRAQRAFAEAIMLSGSRVRILPAPIGQSASHEHPLLDWLPSAEGYRLVHSGLREGLAWLAGA